MLTYPLQKEDVIKVSIERNNELTEIKSVKRRNPYTLKVSVPDFLTDISAIVHVLVEKNGSIIGTRPIKCESKLRELEQILRSITNPVDFMCQVQCALMLNLNQTKRNKKFLMSTKCGKCLALKQKVGIYCVANIKSKSVTFFTLYKYDVVNFFFVYKV